MVKAAKRPEILAMAVKRREIAARLLAFQATYSLNKKGLSAIFGTPEQTVGNWLTGRVLPPPCLVTLLDALEHSDEARRIVGVGRWRVTKETIKKERLRKRRTPPANSFVEPATLEAPFDPELFVEGPVPQSSVIKD